MKENYNKESKKQVFLFFSYFFLTTQKIPPSFYLFLNTASHQITL